MKNTEKMYLGLGLVTIALTPFVLLAPKRVNKKERQIFTHKNYAHRGLHEEDKSVPENSLLAFKRAAEKGYGIELDVQLSKDGKVVVFHDDTLNRVCNVDGRVDSFTYDELKEMPLCNSETETIPLFTEVLKTVSGKSTLIVELKSGPRNDELCKKTLKILRKYKGEFCIESFDPTIVFWFKKNAPDIVRGQLAMNAKRYTNFKNPLMRFMMGNCLFTVLNRPHFIAYQEGKRPLSVKFFRALGGMLFLWTAHDNKGEKENDGMIFEFYRPDTRY